MVETAHVFHRWQLLWLVERRLHCDDLPGFCVVAYVQTFKRVVNGAFFGDFGPPTARCHVTERDQVLVLEDAETDIFALVVQTCEFCPRVRQNVVLRGFGHVELSPAADHIDVTVLINRAEVDPRLGHGLAWLEALACQIEEVIEAEVAPLVLAAEQEHVLARCQYERNLRLDLLWQLNRREGVLEHALLDVKEQAPVHVDLTDDVGLHV